MRTVLLAPPEPVYPTGGFTYNRCVAAELAGDEAFRYINIEPGDESIAPRMPTSVVLLDSLFLERPQLFAGFVDEGHLVGCLLHALPSQLTGGAGAVPSAGERSALEAVDFAVVPSRYMRAHLRRFFPGLDVGVATPGVSCTQAPFPRRRPSPRVPGVRPSLVTVGTISPVKNQLWLAEVLSRYGGSTGGCRWTVVGDATTYRSYVAEFDRASRDPNVEVRRKAPMKREALLPVVAAADAYLQPSRFESYGMAAAEAVALGVPVVASDVGGLSEAVRPGCDGLLCSPEDADCWLTAIDTVVSGGLVPEGTRPPRRWTETAQSLMTFVEKRWKLRE